MLGAMIRAFNPAARLVNRAAEHGFHAVVAKPLPPRAFDELLDGHPAR